MTTTAAAISRKIGPALTAHGMRKGAANGWTTRQDGGAVDITLNYSSRDRDEAALDVIREALGDAYEVEFIPVLAEYDHLPKALNGCAVASVRKTTTPATQEAPVTETPAPEPAEAQEAQEAPQEPAHAPASVWATTQDGKRVEVAYIPNGDPARVAHFLAAARAVPTYSDVSTEEAPAAFDITVEQGATDTTEHREALAAARHTPQERPVSTKQTRQGEIVAVRRTTQPVYTGTNGSTLTGHRIWATAVVRITDDGPDKGRHVTVHMDPEEMLTWAQRMIEAAGETQAMRDDIGHTP
jgi:hypothetical protein